MSKKLDTLRAKWRELRGATEDKLAALNTEIVTTHRKKRAIVKVRGFFIDNGLWPAIEQAAAANTSRGARAFADILADMSLQFIDLDRGNSRRMLADLIADGLMTQAQADALNARADGKAFWWAAHGFTGPITQADLDAAGLT